MVKRCPACATEKDLTEFYPNPKRGDGVSSYCRPCTVAKYHAAPKRKRKPARQVSFPTEKFCPACQETLPIAAFYAIAGRSDGASSYCKECALARENAKYVPQPVKEGLPADQKLCSKCKEVKPRSEFAHHGKTADRLQYYCKPCAVLAVLSSRKKDPASHRQANLVWERENLTIEQKADNNLFHKLGLPHGTYAQMYDKQGGVCAICGGTDLGKGSRRFHVDHCHKTNVVRGLLCSPCNTGLGQFKENINILLLAIQYLNSYSKS